MFVLLDVAVIVSVCVSFVAPELIPLKLTITAAALVTKPRSRSGFRVGRSFTGLIVKRNEVLALVTPSLTVKTIVFVPVWLLPGVMVTLRFVPVPLTTMLVSGTSTVLDELAVTVSNKAAVSTSLMLNGIVIGVSSGVAWLPMAAIVGPSLIAVMVTVKLRLT